MSFDEIDLQWFAAEDEGRTEDATETRLRREREEGRVAKSQELTSAIVMIMCVVALIVAAPHYLRMCEQKNKTTVLDKVSGNSCNNSAKSKRKNHYPKPWFYFFAEAY